MNTVKSTGTDNLEEEVLSGVVHNSHMITVPTHRTAYMEHKFLDKRQHGTHFVTWHLCGMIVSRVDCENLVVFGCVCRIKIVGSYGEALQTDTEHLTFNTVFHIGLLLLENLVQRLLEQVAVHGMVHTHVLTSVVHP